jgi:hypothetical protein
MFTRLQVEWCRLAVRVHQPTELEMDAVLRRVEPMLDDRERRAEAILTLLEDELEEEREAEEHEPARALWTRAS